MASIFRVSMLVDKPLPFERPTGMGAAVYNMALALSKRGITVSLICRGMSDEHFELNDNLEVYTLNHYSRRNLAAWLSVLSRGYEITHAHSSSTVPAIVAARALGRSTVYHVHGDEPLRPLRLTVLRRIGMNSCQRVVATSNDTKQKIIRNHHVSPEKIEVVYNGVDPVLFKPSSDSAVVRSRYGLDKYDRLVVSIGTVQQSKGQIRVIESLPKILQQWPRLGYVNVGAPDDEGYQIRLHERAEALGVSKSVNFFRRIPEQDLIALINAADLCVHPSTREGFGLAVVEEMACAKSVLAYNADSVPEIIEDRVDGFLVSPSDRNQLTDAAIEILDDRNLATRIGEAARKKVLSRFTWDMAASSLEALYRRMLL